MKLVLDTNVLVAAFITHGMCNELLEHCALHHQLILSSHILDEFKRVLRQKFTFSQYEVDEASRLLTSKAVLVRSERLKSPVSRDINDDFVIAAAVAGKCFCIVSGDKGLTDIGEYQGIRIITPAEFWRYEETVG